MSEQSAITGNKAEVVLCCVVCTFDQHVTGTLHSLIVYDRNLGVSYVWFVYSLPLETDH
jgi:hypothetical protein